MGCLNKKSSRNNLDSRHSLDSNLLDNNLLGILDSNLLDNRNLDNNLLGILDSNLLNKFNLLVSY
ncbi:predicted protein [Arabidopsis lyrata subsp. lyrata]|uniref:Predicted protein n=1 Tax=Arabidopsis lyrata subsp. lyrata TaxID=81972 RepID=D7KZ39_ARALL|nr:predicted protein [Arabidopsis lyrata subsp. lyrata]